MQQVEHGRLARIRERLERRIAGAVAGREAGLPDAAPVGRRRDLVLPGAVAFWEPVAPGEVQQRRGGLGAARAGEQPLAVEDHDVRARA